MGEDKAILAGLACSWNMLSFLKSNANYANYVCTYLCDFQISSALSNNN